jgi:antitoxin component of RelBE/YafQ-DinJ toxin-antitoxin module
MKNAVINFKVDQILKRQAQKKAADLGLSLSGVLNAYLRKFTKAKAVDFISEDEKLVPTAYLERILKESQEDIKKGYVSPAFDTIEDELAWLDDPDARYENGRPVQ